MRHIKQFENNNKEYHVITYLTENGYGFTSYETKNFVYDNEEYAFNHLLKHIYDQCVDFENVLDELDNCPNITSLMEVYDTFKSEENVEAEIAIHYNKVLTLNEGDNSLPKDIKLRRDAKKYNL